MSETKPWWQTLLELLEGFLRGRVTEDRLRRDGVQGPILTVSAPLGSFYCAPEPPAGVDESRDLANCHPELAKRYGALKAAFEQRSGHQLFETCTWRSPAKQAQLYAQGRSLPGKILTNCDGVTRPSRHNVFPARGLDVCVDTDPGPGKHAGWDPRLYDFLGPLAAEHGLVWGGTFRGFGPDGDYPHLELPSEVV